MNNPNQTFPDSPTSEKRFPWGCLLGGCLSVFLLIVIGISASFYAGYRFYRSHLETYTSTQPVEIGSVEYSDEEVAAVKQRIEDFKAALEKGEAPAQLVLTADEINAMISSEKELNGKLFVKIKNGQIAADASFPVPEVIPFGKGRYFNGSLSLKASLENGVLIVQVESAEVNGKPVPEQYMSEMRKQNLAKEAYKDSKSAEFLRKFKSLTIEDDKIILVPAEKKADDALSSTPESKEESSATAEISENSDLGPSNQN